MAKAIINVNYGLNGVSINVSVISAFGVPAKREKKAMKLRSQHFQYINLYDEKMLKW